MATNVELLKEKLEAALEALNTSDSIEDELLQELNNVVDIEISDRELATLAKLDWDSFYESLSAYLTSHSITVLGKDSADETIEIVVLNGSNYTNYIEADNIGVFNFSDVDGALASLAIDDEEELELGLMEDEGLPEDDPNDIYDAEID